MDYEGERSKPLITMLVQVHCQLASVGFTPVFNEHGVTCQSIIAWTPPLRVHHQWLAHQRALELVSTLQKPPVVLAENVNLLDSRLAINAAGELFRTEIIESVVGEIYAALLDDMISTNMLAIERAVQKLKLAERPKSA